MLAAWDIDKKKFVKKAEAFLAKELGIPGTHFCKKFLQEDEVLAAYDSLHNTEGHPGFNVMYSMLRERYVCANMCRLLNQRSESCIDCKLARVNKRKRKIPTRIKVWEVPNVRLDFKKMAKVDGCEYAFTVIDYYSRYPYAFPVKAL